MRFGVFTCFNYLTWDDYNQLRPEISGCSQPAGIIWDYHIYSPSNVKHSHGSMGQPRTESHLVIVWKVIIMMSQLQAHITHHILITPWFVLV